VKVGVWLSSKGMEISATLWAMRLRKDCFFTLRALMNWQEWKQNLQTRFSQIF